MRLLLFIVTLWISVALTCGLQCYMCSSHYDSDCINETNTTRVLTCTDFIQGINPITLRCVRIVSLSDSNKQIVVRRCAVLGDCKYVAKHDRQSCTECNIDLCNSGK
ncbi:hypothetical protein DMENIID0001_131170 [Sergentomyia squamirostris]